MYDAIELHMAQKLLLPMSKSLTITLQKPEKADGIYEIQSENGKTAKLFFGNSTEKLPNMTQFAQIELDQDGKGSFTFYGERSIPYEATHITAEILNSQNVIIDQLFAPIPNEMLPIQIESSTVWKAKLAVMSDLHIHSKPGRLKIALEQVGDVDAVLFVGDLVTECSEIHYKNIKEVIDQTIPNIPILAVTGNHDNPQNNDCLYRDFEKYLRNRIHSKFTFHDDPSGAWIVNIGNKIDIIGLNAIYKEKHFFFPSEIGQLEFLDRYLTESTNDHHIILCHAPLKNHDPRRGNSTRDPYIIQDQKLQSIIDKHGNICFFSGHTHLSPNIPLGVAEYDQENNNFYLNAGSLCINDFLKNTKNIPKEWKDGCFSIIKIADEDIELTMHNLTSRTRISNGFYNFKYSKKQSS